MTDQSPTVEFDQLVTAAVSLVNDFQRNREPEFEAVLQHVLAHPELRKFFATRFVELLDTKGSDGDLFAYCMHALRWPEVELKVRSMAMEAEKAGNHRLQFWLGSIMPCFDDHWSANGRSGYKRFGG